MAGEVCEGRDVGAYGGDHGVEDAAFLPGLRKSSGFLVRRSAVYALGCYSSAASLDTLALTTIPQNWTAKAARRARAKPESKIRISLAIRFITISLHGRKIYENEWCTYTVGVPEKRGS